MLSSRKARECMVWRPASAAWDSWNSSGSNQHRSTCTFASDLRHYYSDLSHRDRLRSAYHLHFQVCNRVFLNQDLSLVGREPIMLNLGAIVPRGKISM